MKLFSYLAAVLLTLRAPAARMRWRGRHDADYDADRGDVPGWVMVTVMTAVLVVAILGIFEPQIKTALSGIIKSVSDSGQ